MVDTNELRNRLNTFEFNARPSNSDRSTPATVEDIHNLIHEIKKLVAWLASQQND